MFGCYLELYLSKVNIENGKTRNLIGELYSHIQYGYLGVQIYRSRTLCTHGELTNYIPKVVLVT